MRIRGEGLTNDRTIETGRGWRRTDHTTGAAKIQETNGMK